VIRLIMTPQPNHLCRPKPGIRLVNENQINCMNDTKQRGPFWWLFAIALGLSGFGLAGLLVGIALFPKSNLLGGLALIFGPFWMLGAPMLFVVTMAWIGMRIVQRLKRNHRLGSAPTQLPLHHPRRHDD
jgi:hypothetical protein